MRQTIENAIAATQAGNLSLATQTLQKLSLESPQVTLAQDTQERQKALEIALEILQRGDFQQRWDIAKFFLKFGDMAIAPLISLLENESEDVETRWFAARILSDFDRPSCIVALVELLHKTEEEELLLVAAQSLANIGNTAILALNGLLVRPQTRFLAVKALAQIRRSHVIEPLMQVVNDPRVEIRAIAIEALGSFHDERILPILLAALKDVAASVRKEAAIALGMRAALDEREQLVESLKPLLYDFNLEVCQQAAMALGRMKSDEAAIALFSVLQSSVTPVALKLTLVMALSWIETSRALSYLQTALSWDNTEVRQAIITGLGRQELPALKIQASQILIDFYHSQASSNWETQIKQTLAMALGELGESTAIALLVQLFHEEEATVKLHAIAALKKFPNSLYSQAALGDR
jgi:HEAT repeat protein